MTGRGFFPALPLAVALAAAAAGCSSGAEGGDAGAVAVDSAFVDVLTELQLADARAALVPDSLRSPGLADSLRLRAMDAHGLDSAAVAARLDALADAPDQARATYDAVQQQLTQERYDGGQ